MTSGKFLTFLGFEIKRLAKHPVSILGGAFTGIVFIFIAFKIGEYSEIILKLARGSKELTEESDALPFLIKALTGNYLTGLLDSTAPLLRLFNYCIFLTLPLFVMLISSDQVATDIGRKHLRFLLSRISRGEYFFNRVAVNMVVTCTLLILFVFILDMGITLHSDAAHFSENLQYSFQSLFFLFLYSLSLMSVMTFANSFISNPFLAFLLGMGIWILAVMVSSIGSLINPILDNVRYMFPSGVRGLYFSSGSVPLMACISSLTYTVFFYGIGWLIFKKRDV